MEMPDKKHVFIDEARGVRYEVLAYRELERAEVVEAIRVYLSQHRKRPKRGTCATIVTVIGCQG